VGLEHLFGLGNVLGGESFVNNNVGVGVLLGEFVGLIGPGEERTVVELGLVNGVSAGNLRCGTGEVSPGLASQGHVGEATVVVTNGVPDGVQVGGTTDAGEVLEVATGVT